MKKVIFLIVNFLFLFNIFAQTSLNSIEEQYYDFLSLQGIIERPYLGYRSIITSNWDTQNLKNSIWTEKFIKKEYLIYEDNNNSSFFHKGIDSSIKFQILDLDYYNSVNTASPYGFNDESLWQGKGYNTSLSAGIMGQAFGFRFIFKPRLNFMQNLPFEYIKPNYSDDIYEGKAKVFGDYSLPFIDAPQRFGSSAFATFSLNDTYICYQFYNFILGFGNTNIILGPAYLNPIIHSNNAETYPKVDFGLNKTPIKLFSKSLGYLESHYWVGKLKESKYFDNNSSNDNNIISAFNISYSPEIFPGLTLGYSRTMLSSATSINPYTLFKVLVPFMQTQAGYDESDQRAAIYFDYLIPSGGIDLYLEWAKNDYNVGLANIIRYPFHTQAISTGFKKAVNFSNNLFGELIFEISYLGSSMDYVFFYDWGGIGNSFYTHHYIKQGYTNKGQLLGAALGSGGNSQYLEFKLYYPKGTTSFYFTRNNPDLNYSYFMDKDDPESTTPKNDKKTRIRANLIFGCNNSIFINNKLITNFGISLIDEHNPLNVNNKNNYDSVHRINFNLFCGFNYVF